jgi:uncharacterized protein (DUF1015 family)
MNLLVIIDALLIQIRTGLLTAGHIKASSAHHASSQISGKARAFGAYSFETTIKA